MRKVKNYSFDQVKDTLLEEICTDEKKDDILILVNAHGVAVDDPDWSGLEGAIEEFSRDVTR